MRIAFDHQIFFVQKYGGISRYFVRLAEKLLGFDEEVRIFAPFHCNRYLNEVPCSVAHGRYMNQYPPRTRRMLATYTNLVSNHLINRWCPDILHETYYGRPHYLRTSSPTVTTVHDMVHEIFSSEFHETDRVIAQKRESVFRADHVICVSESTKRDLMRLYSISETKISVVHHGFDRFVTPNVYFQADQTPPRPYLLYVGQRAGYKNFAAFLQAVATSSALRSHFDVIAFGGSKFSLEELQFISSLSFATGQVRHETGDDIRLGMFYRAARGFVYPSLYEGFGFPLLEAMSNECAVICSNTSSLPEVCGSAAEFFDPTSIEDMQRAIESVVYSDARIDVLRQKGSERLKSFSWDRCARETSSIYKSLI